MRSWNRPEVPVLPGHGPIPRLFDTASRIVKPAEPDGVAGLYVCGITPYDATHLGHASTYLAFDTLVRLWLDAGCQVKYVQNVTDVDDPLLERAQESGVDWRELAAEQTDLFRQDMQDLAVIPPDRFVAVTEMIGPIAEAVAELLDREIAYRIDLPGEPPDIYFDIAAAQARSPWRLGQESHLPRPEMLALSAERGGDPGRPGKRDPLDPLLWRSARPGEPTWTSVIGSGRPGWHIECSVIALADLTTPFTVNGGGADLIFPHHEMSTGHATALSGRPLAELYAHTGMVGYLGSKMSKSLGNLVLVSQLVTAGVDPRAVRLAVLAEHYRSDWEWTPARLQLAQQRLARWCAWAAGAAQQSSGSSAGLDLVARLRTVLCEDLDTPGALAIIDHSAADSLATPEGVSAVHALLGIDLRGSH
ncbi:MAG: cysteine--1-D-myo-inosityl 2-amino-2-deoxy-alpha-D-glucopyranoside ligase [Microbacteriaceae bacterium]